MRMRLIGYDWQKSIWRILKNPAFEVVAAIVVVLIAAWILVTTEAEQRTPQGTTFIGRH
jgi:hypothetical protein